MVQVFQGTPTYRVRRQDIQFTDDRATLPATVGACSSAFTRARDGLMLARTHYQPIRPLIEETCQPATQPLLVLTFALEGDSWYRDNSGQGGDIHFSRQHLTITSFQGSDGERHYRAGETLHQLRLVLNADCVRHYLGEESYAGLFRQQTLTRHAYLPFSPATCWQLTQLEQHRHDPLMQQVQMLNLLALHRHLLQPAREKPQHPQDEQRLEQAYAWMKENLAEPFSLSALAMSVGLSDYKLKLGFQHRFNTTPGQLLLQLRMTQAHQLLEAGYQVAQAGWQVGYRHANNFSMAFYRYYGYHARSVGGRRAN
ncbi:helix-turn-helix transcriptional regulator [Erwinia sp. V71]|uniref:helix-turn-helix transcriptional regulator n=1 Tax=Erwinia sp. V71 TaxID=3369424 RepID=UPI003F61D304